MSPNCCLNIRPSLNRNQTQMMFSPAYYIMGKIYMNNILRDFDGFIWFAGWDWDPDCKSVRDWDGSGTVIHHAGREWDPALYSVREWDGIGIDPVGMGWERDGKPVPRRALLHILSGDGEFV